MAHTGAGSLRQAGSGQRR